MLLALSSQALVEYKWGIIHLLPLIFAPHLMFKTVLGSIKCTFCASLRNSLIQGLALLAFLTTYRVSRFNLLDAPLRFSCFLFV